MNTEIFLNNLARYSLQVGLLIGVAAFLPALLRMRHPGARLAFWHVLLATCLILPLVQPITPDVIVVSRPVALPPITNAAASVVVSSGPEFRTSDILLALLAAGVLARLAWLALGFWRLGRYRRESVSLNEADGWTYEAEVRISSQIASPVTFGVRRPVVLLPAGFPALHPLIREAILCHECMHVRRRDWAFIVVEELVRAALWFHPAIWWLLEEIQLTREQAVDRAAVEVTKAKDEYVDALLSVATAKPALDLAPAPLFLRKRHLKRRVVSILKEAQMTKKRLCAALAAALCVTAAACWLVCGAFPLAAAPQVAMDAPGVTVDLGSAGLLHRTPVQYPAAAMASHTEGVVIVEVTLDKAGNVTDARVMSGPEALRKTALESVLQWHFAPVGAGATRQVVIAFSAPAVQPTTAASTTASPATAQLGSAPPPPPPPLQMGVLGTVLTTAPPIMSPSGGSQLSDIIVLNLSDQAKADLLSRLPVHKGDLMDADTGAKLLQAAKEFDEHLTVSIGRRADGNYVAMIAAPTSPVTRPAVPSEVPPPGVQRIKVGANVVAAANLIKKVSPVYPPLAKQARIQGHVILSVVIGREGTIQDMKVSSGHPLLVQAAMEAVRQWQYKPTLLNGNPVEVSTDIDVTFALDEGAPAPPQQ